MWFSILGILFASCSLAAGETRTPNFVILIADDLGYGDLGCYGHPTIRTPHLDRMATEGLKFSQFYAAHVCTPSRAALLTGRLPIRSGLNVVLFPASKGGISNGEITLAQALKASGYATSCVGKWHLGHLPALSPHAPRIRSLFRCTIQQRHGCAEVRASPDPPPPRRNGHRTACCARDPDATLHTRGTFIHPEPSCRRRGPAVLSLPGLQLCSHSASSRNAFRGKSPRGTFGDAVEEIDWSVGQILAAIRDAGLAESTLVVFTSDNGPWLIKKQSGGSAGLLREGKGSTWEGGVRVPCLAWWPGTVAPGRTTPDLASELDLFPTCLDLASAKIPEDRPIDGFSLAPLLRGMGQSPRTCLFYYHGADLFAVRRGPWKLHLKTVNPGSGDEKVKTHNPPLLFHLTTDPSEQFNVADRHPDVVEQILKEIDDHRRGVKPGPPQT